MLSAEEIQRLKDKISGAKAVEQVKECSFCQSKDDLYICDYHKTIFCFKCLSRTTERRAGEIWPQCKQVGYKKECVHKPL